MEPTQHLRSPPCSSLTSSHFSHSLLLLCSRVYLACPPRATEHPATQARAISSGPESSTPSRPKPLTSVTSACTPSDALTTGASPLRDLRRGTSSTSSRSATSALPFPALSPSLLSPLPCSRSDPLTRPPLALPARFVRDSNVDPSTLSWEDQLAHRHCPSSSVVAWPLLCWERGQSAHAHAFLRRGPRRRDPLQRVRRRQPQALQERRSASVTLPFLAHATPA